MVLLIFIFGLAIGSFINAAVFRLRENKSLVFDRSRCPKCGHILSWHELIPLLSFLIQLGRCRACKQKISFQYPIVELTAGILFVFVFDHSLLAGRYSLDLWYLLLVFSALLFIFVFDLKYYIIPNRVLYPLIAIVLLYNLFISHWRKIQIVACGRGCFRLLFALYLIRRKVDRIWRCEIQIL